MKYTLAFLVFFLSLAETVPVFGQNVVLQNASHKVKWKSISTPQFQVLFQDGYNKEAKRVANTLQYLAGPASKSLGVSTGKISVVLQNQQSISNGFVAVAPWRSEFYTMPPQDYNRVGTNHYIDHLAVHEFRHVAQYQKAKTGWTKAVYRLFGEGAFGVISGLAAPSWFWEGDAVAIETALTPAGRGRIPRFDLLYRTNLLERGQFNYHKQYLGSFKHQVPNWYVLGYHMISHARREYDGQVWDRVTQRAFNFPFVPFVFSYSMRKETGQNLLSNYKAMNAELNGLWTGQLHDLPITDYELINIRSRKGLTDYDFPNVCEERYTDYEYPTYLDNGNILALKSGIADIQQFVEIAPDGKEKVIFTPGIFNDAAMLSVENQKIVWNEFHYHPRWRAINYSVIKTYDINTKKLRTVTRKSRFSSAAFSPDGKYIATVEVDQQNHTSVLIIDASSGKTFTKFSNSENYFYQTPRFSQDGASIVAVKTGNEGKTLAVFDLDTKEEVELFPFSHENIGHPIWNKGYIFYNSPYSGIDNIYAYRLSDGKKLQVTSSKFGAYSPSVSPSGEAMVYNDFDKDGMRIVKIKMDTAQWVPIDQVQDRQVKYYQPLVEQEGNPNIFANVPDNEFPVQNYSRIKGLVNIHSWGPYWTGSYTSLTAGLFSQDVLSNAIISTGINFNANERSGNLFANISYQTFFPIIELGASSGYRSAVFSDTRVLWNEDDVSLAVRLPLLLTHSKYHEGLNLTARARLINMQGEEIRSGYLHTNNYNISYYRLLKQSPRDLISKWGQSGFVSFSHAPFGGLSTWNFFMAQGTFNFPGLFKNHGIQVIGGGQFERGNYPFSSSLLFPRGMLYERNEYLGTLSLNYWMPLLYPDLVIGPVFYLQRIKTNLFLDHATGFNPNAVGYRFNYYNSVGLDLMFDYNLFRIRHVLLESGIRMSYHPDFDRFDFQFIIGSIGF